MRESISLLKPAKSSSMLLIRESKDHLETDSPRHSFESLGLPPCELGDICVTDPFPLFSVEAVAAMRAEIFRHDTLDKSLVSNSDPEYKRCANVIRGYADPGTFNHALWTGEDTT